MTDERTSAMWRGKRLEECSKEELIEAVLYLGKTHSEYYSAAAVIKRARERIYAIKGGLPK